MSVCGLTQRRAADIGAVRRQREAGGAGWASGLPTLSLEACRADAAGHPCTRAHQEQNRRLRIELLALRQAARVAGLDSLLVNSTVLGVPDETLGLTEAAVQHRGQEGAGEAEAAAAQSGGTTPRRHLHLRRGGGQAAPGRTAQS